MKRTRVGPGARNVGLFGIGGSGVDTRRVGEDSRRRIRRGRGDTGGTDTGKGKKARTVYVWLMRIWQELGVSVVLEAKGAWLTCRMRKPPMHSERVGVVWRSADVTGRQ